MMHDWKAFGEEISTLLKTSGDSGDSGDKAKNANNKKALAVPTSRADVSPLQSEWGQHRAASGDNIFEEFQLVTDGVPTVSTVPTNFAGGADHEKATAQESHSAHSKTLKLPADLPSDWRAGFAAFCVMPPPDHFLAHRWEQAVHDGFAFLSAWGPEAYRLGWTATDLFGGSASSPWSRVGMLGLVPLLNGDTVVDLSEKAAIIESKSGSRLAYRRHVASGGRVCLWEMGALNEAS